MPLDSILVDPIWPNGHLGTDAETRDDEIENALRAVRLHLGMEIGFVTEFTAEERIFRYVDCDLENPPFRVGQIVPLDSGYCAKVVAGELPELIADTAFLAAALEIPETFNLPIGSHLSVPIRMKDGSIFGTFCCFSATPDVSLNGRDLRTLRAVAEMVAGQLERKVHARREETMVRARLDAVMAAGQPRIVYQPIVRLNDRSLVGFEALARFSGLPEQGPDRWFADAESIGARQDLERAALHNALDGAAKLWSSGAYIALNVSPKTVVDDDFASIFSDYPLDRIVLELTEHEDVEDYELLAQSLEGLRRGGIRIAVDDAGSGYASLRHVLNIHPDIIKLDLSLTSGIDHDPVKQALAAAIVRFGRHVSCKVVAEGIETDNQYTSLRSLGIEFGQGYLISRPLPPDQLVETLIVS